MTGSRNQTSLSENKLLITHRMEVKSPGLFKNDREYGCGECKSCPRPKEVHSIEMGNNGEEAKNRTKVQYPRHEEESQIGGERGQGIKRGDTTRLEQNNKGLKCDCQEKHCERKLSLIEWETILIYGVTEDSNHKVKRCKRLQQCATDPVYNCPCIDESTLAAVLIQRGILKEIFLWNILIQGIEEYRKSSEEGVVGRKG